MIYYFNNPSYVRHVNYLKSIFNSDLSQIENIKAINGLEQSGLERKSGIYAIINIVTGDYYIGSSSDARTRKNTHWRAMEFNKEGGNKLLKRHTQKYGIDKFKFLFIHHVDKSDLIQCENFWIKALCPFYNLTSIALRSESTASKRQKISIFSKHKRDNSIYKVPVIQMDLSGNFIREWDSIKSATIGVGAAGGHISYACRQNKIAFGFRWAYKNGITKSRPRLKSKKF